MSELKRGLNGRTNPQFSMGLKDFKTYVKTGVELPAPPGKANDYGGVTSWPMDGIDQFADCTKAAAAHSIQAWNTVTKRSDSVRVNSATLSCRMELTTRLSGVTPKLNNSAGMSFYQNTFD